MNILAFLQNQWAHQPWQVLDLFARRPAHRTEIIRRMLARSYTGSRLRAAFGDDLFDAIVWDNASPVVTSRPRPAPRRDVWSRIAAINHVDEILARARPAVVLAFGQVAQWAMNDFPEQRCITGPHPAARRSDTAGELQWMARELRALVQEHTP